MSQSAPRWEEDARDEDVRDETNVRTGYRHRDTTSCPFRRRRASIVPPRARVDEKDVAPL